MGNERGIVCNIQHYSIHDGPGVRTIVFLKGCPLRCRWCANPETQAIQPQLMVLTDRCVGCGACKTVCPRKAVRLEGGKAVTDRGLCAACGTCRRVCKADARSIMGETMSVEDIVAQAAEDSLFYAGTGGGVTLSGGEVLLQADFAAAILKGCRKSGIHTAIETCGFADWEGVRQVAREADLILYDLKHMDSERHRQGTGQGNERILENLARISEKLKKTIWVRVPLIAGYNDDEDHIRSMASFLKKSVSCCEQVHLLPYHNLGEGKKIQLEWKNGYYEGITPASDRLACLKEILRKEGFLVP